MATDGDRPEKNISEPEGQHGGHGEFVLAGPTHNYEYEPDKFAVKTILAVPVAVIITGLLAFVTTWLLFTNIFDPKIQDAPENQLAANRNDVSLNERFGRISSTDPNAEVQQPRLEGLEKTQVYPRDGNPDNKDPNNLITSEMSTTQRTKEGNSPQYHAEELRPGRIKELNSSRTDPQTGVTRVPVDEAMKLLVDGKLLPAQEGALRLDVELDWDRPKESNGGRAKPPEPTKPAAAKKDEKKDPNGKETEKKEPEKKEPEKKGGEPEKK
jgi:hypothetical protein